MKNDMSKEKKKIFNDKDRIVISGNDIDSIFISDIDFTDDNNYPVVNIGNIEVLNNISKNSKNYNNLKRDRNTDILSISGESIDRLEDDIESSNNSEENNNEKEISNTKDIPSFNESDIIQVSDNKDNEDDFNGILSQIDLDNAIISYENDDNNALLKDSFENDSSSNSQEDEKIKKLANFFEDVLNQLPKNKRKEILMSESYKDYMSIINGK